MSEILSSFSDFFVYPFLAKALLGSLLLALSCGLLSPLLVAKRFAFIGEGISHSSLLAVAISSTVFALSSPLSLFLSTLLITLGLSLALAYGTAQEKIPSDAVIGIFLTATLSAGILLLSFNAQQKSQVMNVLFGNILTLQKFDLLGLMLITFFLIAVVTLLKRSLIFSVYDEKGAQVYGEPVTLYHYGFIAVLALLIVCSIKLAGTILVNALLIIPGAFALKFAKNIKQTFFYSIGFSLFAAVLGIYMANALDLPPGAVMALTYFLLFIFSHFLGKIMMKKTIN